MAKVKVFKTKSNSTDDVEIAGVGLLGAGGKGGVRVDSAAAVMTELQEKDDDGQVVVRDGLPVPLEGAALNRAAEQFAEDRGIRVVSVDEDKAENLAQELGVAPDRPPARDVSIEEYEAAMAGLEPVNENPDELVEGGPEAGEPAVPDSKEE